jgi:hypothetical protein
MEVRRLTLSDTNGRAGGQVGAKAESKEGSGKRSELHVVCLNLERSQLGKSSVWFAMLKQYFFSHCGDEAFIYI